MARASVNDALGEALHECGKNLALALVHYRNARNAYETERAAQIDKEVTDASLYVQEDPPRLVFRILGPLPTTNLELRRYLPRDRYVWGTLKDWWHGQITSAIEARGGCPKLSTAAVVVQVSSKADLDNLGLKCLMDALVRNGIVPSDKPEVIRFLAVEPMETDHSEIRLCVFEPDEGFKKALEIIRSKTVLTNVATVPRTPFEEGDFFFQGQE